MSIHAYIYVIILLRLRDTNNLMFEYNILTLRIKASVRKKLKHHLIKEFIWRPVALKRFCYRSQCILSGMHVFNIASAGHDTQFYLSSYIHILKQEYASIVCPHFLFV